MKQTALILLAALNASAQLVITSTDPHGSHVWESENGTHWTRTIAFSNSVEIPIGSEAVKLFKTEARKGPVTLEVIDNKQTLRGRSNKPITNLTVTTEAGTFEGWTEFRSYDADGTEFFQWRFPSLPNSTNAVITATDCDGFTTTTNVIIEQAPSDYTEPPKPGFPIRSGFSAAGTNDRAGDIWVTGSLLSYVFTQHQRGGFNKESTATGDSTADTCRLSQSRREWFGTQVPLVDCSALYRGGSNWRMVKVTNTGSCYYSPFKIYPTSLEMSSYNDSSTWNPKFVQSERLVRSARTSAMAFVGHHGLTNVCQIRITYTWERVVGRNETEVFFEGVATNPVATVGCTGKPEGAWFNVADNSFVDVTPQIAVSGDWMRYSVRFERTN